MITQWWEITYGENKMRACVHCVNIEIFIRGSLFPSFVRLERFFHATGVLLFRSLEYVEKLDRVSWHNHPIRFVGHPSHIKRITFYTRSSKTSYAITFAKKYRFAITFDGNGIILFSLNFSGNYNILLNICTNIHTSVRACVKFFFNCKNKLAGSSLIMFLPICYKCFNVKNTNETVELNIIKFYRKLL